MLVDDAWNRVLDDDEAEGTECCACRGRGIDRHGEDCADCGGLGVWF